MHLIDLYSRDLNVDIGKPILSPHFYPLTDENYVTIHTSDKVPAKNYSYWAEVVSILRPELDKRGIALIQVGTKEDPQITGVHKFINNTTFNQLFHILKGSKCHVGIDSCPVHLCSHFDVPTVSIYAHSYAKTCDPIWNKEKAIVIESDRGGDKPSFSYSEDPKKIDILKPEQIANAVFKQLGFKTYNSIETTYVGKKFLHKTVDIIPTEMPKVETPSGCDIVIRMDLCFNENICLSILNKSNDRVKLKTDRPFSDHFLNLTKSKISEIEYTSNEFEEEDLNKIRSLGINLKLKCTDKSKLKDQRLKFFDYEIEEDKSLEEAKSLKEEFEGAFKKDKLRAFSGKYYINGDKISSFIGGSKDDINFWIDVPYFFCYTEVSK